MEKDSKRLHVMRVVIMSMRQILLHTTVGEDPGGAIGEIVPSTLPPKGSKKIFKYNKFLKPKLAGPRILCKRESRVEGPTTADDLTTADYDRNNKITTLQMSKKN